MSYEEPRRQPMPPELEARLRPGARVYKKGGTGYRLEKYVDVVRQVHATHEGAFNIEVEFPNVHPKHVEQVLRRQAGENGLAVMVGHSDEYGVYAIYAGLDGLMDDEVEVGPTLAPDELMDDEIEPALQPDKDALVLTDE